MQCCVRCKVVGPPNVLFDLWVGRSSSFMSDKSVGRTTNVFFNVRVVRSSSVVSDERECGPTNVLIDVKVVMLFSNASYERPPNIFFEDGQVIYSYVR